MLEEVGPNRLDLRGRQADDRALAPAAPLLDLVHRVRPAGSRRDQYVVDTDVWQEVTLSQAAVLGRWVAQMDAGLALVADDSPAAERLRRSKDFFTFIDEEMAGLKERWEARRASWSGSV